MKKKKRKLAVNRGRVQVNIRTRVNAESIRRETLNGREHIVMPSYTLPGNVIMNGGLYPAKEIDAHYQELEGTLAPLGHPTLDGQFVSAFSPEGINVGHVGAWNRNVKKSGNRIFLEKWLDVEFAKNTEGGRRLLERVEALDSGEDVPPIHTSVAVFLEQLPAPDDADYDWVAKIEAIDHDAILLDEPGAATPEQGVGLLVNAADARPVANAGVLEGETFGERMTALNDAASALFPDDFVYIADFTQNQAVVVKNGEAELYEYEIDGDKITFSAQGVPVKRKETWALKLNRLIFGNRGRPESGEPKEKSDMDEKDQAKLREAIKADIGDIIKPLSDQVAELKSNQDALNERLTASERAAETEKRTAVAEKFGKDVAEGLTGNALDALYKQCGKAASLAGNSGEPEEKPGAPDPDSYFKGEE